MCWPASGQSSPLVNAIYFLIVPMFELVAEEERMSFRDLAGNGTFWLMIIFMFCAGSCEMGIAQWASNFAEDAALDCG